MRFDFRLLPSLSSHLAGLLTWVLNPCTTAPLAPIVPKIFAHPFALFSSSQRNPRFPSPSPFISHPFQEYLSSPLKKKAGRYRPRWLQALVHLRFRGGKSGRLRGHVSFRLMDLGRASISAYDML